METWDLMNNWNLVVPPSRPSASQLNTISSFISGYDRKKPVAVLGSTPEFRDLLFELGFQNIFVFEKNTKFYRQVSLTRIYKNPEEFVYGDWLETLSNYREYFALILSDLTSGNISYLNRQLFYELITCALAQDGLFCDKVLTHPNNNLTIACIVEKYQKLPLNLVTINYFSCEALFCSELLDINKIVDSTLFYKILDEQISNKRVRAFVKYAPLITPKDCVWYYGEKWQTLVSSYCPRLVKVLQKEDEQGSPYFNRAKLFILKKV